MLEKRCLYKSRISDLDGIDDDDDSDDNDDAVTIGNLLGNWNLGNDALPACTVSSTPTPSPTTTTCSYTQNWWQTKSNSWPKSIPSTSSVCGVSYKNILGSTSGDPFYSLGRSFVTSSINVANGCDKTPIDTLLTWCSTKALPKCSFRLNDLAAVYLAKLALDMYNGGFVKNGPKHCSDECSSPQRWSGDSGSSGDNRALSDGQAAWFASDWTPCSQPCGSGVQVRTVVCGYSDGRTASDSDCASLTAPVAYRQCNSIPCSRYGVYSSAWTECDATCDGGTQYRTVLCADATTGAYPTDPTTKCNDLDAYPTSKSCSTQTCPEHYWRTTAWSNCTKVCGGGTQTRTVECVDSTTSSVVDVGMCISSSKPAESRGCHQGACVTYGWNVGSWGPCSRTCGGGFAARQVTCQASDGSNAASSGSCQGVLKLPEVMECGTDPCDFCNGEGCSGHGVCANAKCACGDGYTGKYCQLPPGCEGHAIDILGRCCTTAVDKVGMCCSGGEAVLDKDAMCCESGVLDALGVCDGLSSSVDAAGAGCDVLDYGGLCCKSGNIDTCGVCDGDGTSCATVAVLHISTVQNDGANASTSSQYGTVEYGLASMLGADVSTIETVDSGEYTSAGWRRRRLLQSGTTGTITFKYNPNKASTSTSSGALGLNQISTALSAASGGQLAGTDTTIDAVANVTAEGVCGNRLCEMGERCGEDGVSTCCALDCPYSLVMCPLSNTNGQQCSAHGVCHAASGTCACYSGYTGTDCSECATSWYRDSGSATCLPASTRSNAGGSGATSPSAKKSSALGIALGAGLGGALLLVLVIIGAIVGVYCCRRRRRANKVKDVPAPAYKSDPMLEAMYAPTKGPLASHPLGFDDEGGTPRKRKLQAPTLTRPPLPTSTFASNH
eukprot:jgi/Chlat1/8807/Chrsp90S08122